ncbi:MAG: glycosyltransferase family 4 protein [Wolinella sp.]
MKSKLRLIINLSNVKSPLTGIGRYTYEMTKRLIQHSDVVDIQAFHGFRWLQKSEILELLKSQENHTQCESKKKVKFKIPYAIRKLHHIAMCIKHYKKLIQHKDYIYWDNNYIPLPFPGETITTIHDLSHIRFPHFHPEFRVKMLNNHLSNTVKKSSKIVTISDFSKREIMGLLGVNEDKITVIYPGVDESFSKKTEESISKITKKYNLPNEYILSVATLEPRKNLVGLIKAFSMLSDELRTRFPLVLVGSSGWLNSDIDEIISKLKINNEVRILGYLPQYELPYIYAGASAFAYVSFYEGYGMPIAEALACGTPVLTSNCSSMVEAGGKSAVYVDPTNVDSIRDGLEKILTNPPLNIDTSHIYSWDIASAKLIDSCKKLTKA